MKRKFYPCFLALALSLAATVPAVADEGTTPFTPSGEVAETTGLKTTNNVPEITAPIYVAITFYKLARQKPDLDAWAQMTQAYKEATDFDKPTVQQDQAAKLKAVVDLQTAREPLVIQVPVQLSALNAANQGYFIESFKKSTFFPVTFADRNYALVPQGIIDHQWMKLDSPEAAKPIEAAAALTKRLFNMVLVLAPQYADNSGAANINGQDYWPLAVKIDNMILVDQNGLPLWQSNAPEADTTHDKILKLRQ